MYEFLFNFFIVKVSGIYYYVSYMKEQWTISPKIKKLEPIQRIERWWVC